ncbi:MAG TPA: head GIN domain-containing protein [Bacteroidales bacterium]|nr:head GIN domain-containing protein [Bacteroidales bacterium]HPJ59715.1 head GIN domain-containing protein [Bacteroidales bacterium]HPR11312.1 head GIN domain-containing protein [Bacteroidales bacterium]HRW86013.1 head GIN domain-containing protein [Bacteroidales bacterium]
MKNFRYLTVIALSLSIFCCAECQPRKTVHGNGNVVKKERNADNFTGVSTSSAIDVILSQGDKNSIVVEADENLHEYILTELKNGTLHIYTDANIRDAEEKKVHVTMKEISFIGTSSAGDVLGITPLKTGKLKLSATSAGDIKAEVYTSEIDISASSSGDVTLTGEADFLEARLSSAGDLNAFNLKVKEADVNVSSAGDADIFVTGRLVARASSAGDINYKGNPETVDARSSSAGGINRK